MKKRIYLGMLALCLALTATACGSSKDTTDTAADTAKTQENTEDKKAEVGTGRLVSVENVDKYITIGEYKGLILDNTVSAITDEDVQVQINEDLQDKAEPVSDGAQEGDLVTINYTGTIDGKTFDSGTANNYDFVVGQGTMFDEFEQGVIGMKKGDTKEIDIDFPSDYGDSIVAGQNVSYKVTVQNVRRVAELTDEWVAKNTDYTTVDEYKEGVRAQLEQDAKDSAEEVLKSTAWSTVLENSEVKEYPQEDLDNAVSEFKSSMEVYAKQADMTLEEFVESQGISQDDFEGGKPFNETVCNAICAVIKILGKNCLEVNTNAVTDRQGKFVYDMITIKYENALATIEIGTTVDVEDEMVIIGSNGRVTIPNDWWNTGYFEANISGREFLKRYSFNFDGNGFRYLLQELMIMIRDKRTECTRLFYDESVKLLEVLETINQKG